MERLRRADPPAGRQLQVHELDWGQKLRRYTPAVAAAALSAIATLASVSSASAQAEPYVGQLMLTAATFCPQGWQPANGQILSISQNEVIFSLLGTTYGGDGQTNFALPNLQGRAPIHTGQGAGLANYSLGQPGGAEQFTIALNELPPHSHTVQATNATADKGGPAGRYLGGGVGDDDVYHDGPADRIMAADMIAPAGGGQPITHRGPFLTMMWCVAMQGIYPSRP